VEFASAVDFHDGNVESMLRLLTITARAQAADAHHLFSRANQLTPLGLLPVVSEPADLEVVCRRPGEAPSHDATSERHGVDWTIRETSMFAEALRQEGDWRAIETPWGLSVTFSLDRIGHARSVLEVRPGTGGPLADTGIDLTLRTPVNGGLLEAMAWNERELRAEGPTIALGGWWASDEGVLVHRAFYPADVWQPDLVSEIMRASMRRARAANTAFQTGVR
jgi:hypothetical protein